MKFVQLNTQHKKVAMDNLFRDMCEQNIDCAIIQEPYISNKSETIPGLPPEYKQYHNGVNSATAIIIRSTIKHFFVSEYTTERQTVIKVDTEERNREKLLIVSLYCPRGQEPLPNEWLSLTEKKSVLGNNLVAGIDTNCHSILVGYPKSDKRAVEWEEFMATQNLTIHNEDNIMTFCNSRNYSSCIDWTLKLIT